MSSNCTWCRLKIDSNQIQVHSGYDVFHHSCFLLDEKYNILDAKDFSITKELDNSMNGMLMNPVQTGYRSMVDQMMKERKLYYKNFSTSGSLLDKLQDYNNGLPKTQVKQFHLGQVANAETKYVFKSLQELNNTHGESAEKAKDSSIVIKKPKYKSNNWLIKSVTNVIKFATSDEDENMEADEEKPKLDTKMVGKEKLRFMSLQYLYDYCIDMTMEPVHLIAMLESHTSPILMMEKGVTIYTFTKCIRDISLFHFFVNDYTLDDLIFMGISWASMLTLGFDFELWLHFKRLISIHSLCTVFQLKMIDIIEPVFHGEIENIIRLEFSVDDLVALDCDYAMLTKFGIENHHIKQFKFSKEDWLGRLGANLQDVVNS